jgi:hypothetical protein
VRAGDEARRVAVGAQHRASWSGCGGEGVQCDNGGCAVRDGDTALDEEPRGAGRVARRGIQ